MLLTTTKEDAVKGDYEIPASEITGAPPPDFCQLGRHSDEIRQGEDGGLIRHCNDCGRELDVQPDECIDTAMEWHPEHDFHFGVCRRCDAEEID
jgi:hypothetical protein